MWKKKSRDNLTIDPVATYHPAEQVKREVRKRMREYAEKIDLDMEEFRAAMDERNDVMNDLSGELADTADNFVQYKLELHSIEQKLRLLNKKMEQLADTVDPFAQNNMTRH
jgi:phage-related minor tail protein